MGGVFVTSVGSFTKLVAHDRISATYADSYVNLLTTKDIIVKNTCEHVTLRSQGDITVYSIGAYAQVCSDSNILCLKCSPTATIRAGGSFVRAVESLPGIFVDEKNVSDHYSTSAQSEAGMPLISSAGRQPTFSLVHSVSVLDNYV